MGKIEMKIFPSLPFPSEKQFGSQFLIRFSEPYSGPLDHEGPHQAEQDEHDLPELDIVDPAVKERPACVPGKSLGSDSKN